MLQHRFTFGVILAHILFIACGPSRPQEDDEEDIDCAMLYNCGGICVSLATDPANCGSCGYVCGEGTNDCVDFRCLCRSNDGNTVSADACKKPAVCDNGTGLCLTPDPFGESCNEIEEILCDDSRKVCVDGYCTAPDCDHPEICDLLDNNCDGLTDELPDGGNLIENCYSGPPATADIGICSVGLKTCVAGSWTLCQGEQGPVAENGLLNCDGLDNDCDTCADNTWAHGMCVPKIISMTADIVFIIDRSGSMWERIAAIKDAVQSWTMYIGANPNILFGLVDPTDSSDPDGVSVDQSLTDYLMFNAVVAGLDTNGSGIEPLHYAVHLVANGSFDVELGLRSDALRFIIVIGDESTVLFYSYNAVSGVDEALVCSEVAASGTILAVMTHSIYFNEWDACTSATSMPPTALPLSSDLATMSANLNLIIDSPCF